MSDDTSDEVKVGLCLHSLEQAAKDLSRLGYAVTVKYQKGGEGELKTKLYKLYSEKKIHRRCTCCQVVLNDDDRRWCGVYTRVCRECKHEMKEKKNG